MQPQVLLASAVAGSLLRRKRLQAKRSRLPRRFFNFGQPEEVIDPDDPGRPAVVGEYQNMPGSIVTGEQSEFGWAMVSRHDASEQDGFWPTGSPPGPVKQEWRELRLADGKEGARPGLSEGTGQSVVKVSLVEGEPPAQVPYCMTLAYTKSLCAAALSGAHAQGALPLDASIPPLRALVIGLGAGSIPVWLEHTFPTGSITVDACELDPAVVTAVTNEMGFPKAAIRPTTAGDAVAAAADAAAGAGGQPVRVYVVGGETFVESLGKVAPQDYLYDLVFIDAFDKKGKVPPVLVDPAGPFLQALGKLLSPKATIVLNLLVGMTGTGSSGGPVEIQAMVSAIYKTCCQESSEVFTIRTPIQESSGNQLYGFLRAGREIREGPLKEALRASAEAVNENFPADRLGKKIRFQFARRVTYSYQDWKPSTEPFEGPKSAKLFGGLFGG